MWSKIYLNNHTCKLVRLFKHEKDDCKQVDSSGKIKVQLWLELDPSYRMLT